MRTKTLLLTAALSAAGVLSSMAVVTSVNVVGYINVSVPVGFSFIANQLVAASDTVANLIPAPADGTVLYTWGPAGFAANPYNLFGDNTWDDATVKLSVGSGGLIFNASPAPFTITFVGEVKQGSLSTAIEPGFQFVSSQVPQEGSLSALNFTPTSGDVVYQWGPNGFEASSFDLFGDKTWDPSEPTLKVGQSVLLNSATGVNWDRNFVVP